MIRVLSNARLAPFLKRHLALATVLESELRLDSFLRLALEKAAEFVPSESGAIFLDDPSTKGIPKPQARELQLAGVACFGSGATRLLGRKRPAHQGILGKVYSTGRAHLSGSIDGDPRVARELDHRPGFRARSVLCVPIRIRDSVIGVLELVNKRGRAGYTSADLELLRIFADYISASIQNFLDAKRNQEMLRRDHLTGLANDRELFARLEEMVRRAWRKRAPLTLAFLDLDGFKGVNDRYGHLAGSRVLAEVGEILRCTVRQRGALLARYGGDEYVVVLPGQSSAMALRTAQRIRENIYANVFLSEPSPEVPALKLAKLLSCSIGVAELLEHVGEPDPGKLIRLSDEAMYAAKRRGKNRVFRAQPRSQLRTRQRSGPGA